MDDKSYNIRVPRRWVRVGMIVTVTALIVAPLTAIASHTFTDVSDSNTFHADIDWLAGADITKGCNPPTNDEFCPNDSVTRGQMSAFMRRFAQFIDAEDGTPAEADNADTVDGQHAEDLASGALLVNSSGTVNLPGGTTTELLALELPPGQYALTTSAILNNNAASAQGVLCEFSAGSASINTSSNLVLDPLSGPGDRESITLHLVADIASTTNASFSCTTTAGWLGNVIRPQVLAVSLQSVASSVASADTVGSDEG